MLEIPKETKSVKLLRDNAVEILLTTIKKAFKMGVSASETFVHIDEIIDAYEMVGLFNSNELRRIIVSRLENDINERKKENH